MFHVMQTGGADRFVTIRRCHLLTDSLNTMSRMPTLKLKKQIRISFIDEHGVAEAGIDAGGLFKDFIERLIKVRRPARQQPPCCVQHVVNSSACLLRHGRVC